jgi:hypothetical protein
VNSSVIRFSNTMVDDDSLIPDLDWLAASCDPDDTWHGPGPMLLNLQPWMEHLYTSGHGNLVAATYAAAETARSHWDTWLARSRNVALESILDAQPPTGQLAAVRRWLDSPTDEHKTLAIDTIDLTKQLHWFDEEYGDVWFDEPGMWAVESSEYCVLSLTGAPDSQDTLATFATISVSCAVNSFRTSADDDIRNSFAVVLAAIRRQLTNAG